MNPELQGFSTGLLDVKYFDPEVQRLMLNATHGLRMATNNKGVIVGNQIRFPLGDTDGMAKRTSKGSPIDPDDLLVRSVNADIHAYEASARLFPEDLNSTNSESSLRAMAAEKVYNSMENRFTVDVLNALEQYDDTEMEIGSADTPFTVKTIDEINLLAGNNNWGMADRYMLLPYEAQYTLMQDEKFYEIWSLTNGKALVDNVGKSGDADNMLRWTPYRGFMIAFMAKQKDGKNLVGLPTADDGSILGFAWKRSRVGFGMNDTLQSRIFQDPTKEGNPIVFKTNGSSGAAIIDKSGVIGIKIDATPLN